jgi:hypothetical protein
VMIILGSSCVNHEKTTTGLHMETNDSELSRLKDANPVNDADEAIRRNDLRFLAVKGYAITVPGIDDYYTRFSSKYKYRIIEGTSDVIRNEEERQLQNRAIRYAEVYNVVIRDYVAKQK